MMRIGSVSSLVLALALLASNAASAQSSAAASWSLPRGMAVSDSGSRVYRFTVDYQSADPRGSIVLRQRISGEYTRGLVGGARWNGRMSPSSRRRGRARSSGLRKRGTLWRACATGTIWA